jgi:hypothetical protein
MEISSAPSRTCCGNDDSRSMTQQGGRGRCARGVSPNEGGLGLALGVAKVQDQGQVPVVDGDAGDIDDARNALLELCQRPECDGAGVSWWKRTLDSSDRENMMLVCEGGRARWSRGCAADVRWAGRDGVS